jgi:hypothetical protein
MYSLFGLLILVLDIWAIVQILNSRDENGTKVLWIVVIVLLPVLGLLLWSILGRKT